MINKDEIIRVAQSTIDMLAVVADWEEVAMLKAMDLDIHGEKRKNRYEGTKDTCIKKHLQCKIKDKFGITILSKPIMQHADLSSINDPEKFFMAYLDILWQMYEKLHEASNKFVTLYMKPLTCALDERCCCIDAEIDKVNRRLSRGRKAGWSHDLLIYEQGWENVHDEYEQKENEAGYKY